MLSFFNWLEKVGHTSLGDLVYSVLLLISLFLLRLVVVRVIARNKHLSIEMKRRFALVLRNVVFALCIFGLFVIWSSELRTLALSLAAFAVALAVATKEIIMCLAGAFLRAVGNSYGLGDHVCIGHHQGQVVDINLLSTTIMEIGPHNVQQYTGRAISFPNSLLLTTSVIRLDYTGDYVVHSISIPMPFGGNIDAAQKILMETACSICEPFLEDARKYMKRLEIRSLVDTPSVEPRFAIESVDDTHVRLIIRVAIPKHEQHRVEQTILLAYMREVGSILGKN